MRKAIIVGNWKMNNTKSETKALIEALKPLIAGNDKVEVGVAPTFTSLEAAAEALKGSNIALCAQNISYAKSGAYTGEISADMLKEIGVTHAIIGHSERRTLFGESDEDVAKRVRTALDNGLTPIMCIGETLQERESGKTFDVVLNQVQKGLAQVSAEESERVVLAYEPVWAIGTGKTASPEQAQEVHEAIRNKLASIFCVDCAKKIRIQYGGSVKASNAAELLSKKDIDGALVGGASLKAEDFAGIIKAI
ncbi:MAG: triose-phosphate isomerase [Bradymonadales bacterium]|jgi:triosephosphate isomerase